MASGVDSCCCHWRPAAWGPAASGQHPRAPHRPCTLTPTQLATPGNLQAKAKSNFALNRTPGDSRELRGEEKPRPWSAGYGTRDGQPGAACTAGWARFRAYVGCLCSSQVGVAETPASPSPRPALVWAYHVLPSWVLGSWKARPQGFSPPPSRTLTDKGKAAAPVKETQLHARRCSSHCCSVVSTLCDLMNSSTPGLPVHHQILELIQTHVQ